MSISATALAVTYTAQQILERALTVARLLGLAVSSWRTDDPTKVLFNHLAEELALRDQVDAEFCKGAFLSTAEGDWKTVHAKEVYGVDRDDAGYVQPTVSFINNGGGYYTPGAGEVTVKSTLTGKTYHNTQAFSLLGVGTTATVNFIADEPGTESNCGTNEIDALVTALLEVAITGSTAATTTDEQDDASLETECLNTLGALSPNGPSDAYDAVILDSALTGTVEVTKTQYLTDSTNGLMTAVVAGPAGSVSGAAITACQTAASAYARPIGFTVVVVNSIEQTVALTATISGADIPADYDDQAAAAFTSLLESTATRIGGKITRSALTSMLQVLAVNAGATNVSVNVTVPAADVTLPDGYVAVPGAISVTEV